MVEDNFEDDHISSMTTQDIIRTSRLLDNEMRVLEVVDIINSSSDECRPKVMISSSACVYYGTSETLTFDEQSPPGIDYLAEVCREWEEAAQRVNTNVRLMVFHIGVVLGLEGGALGGTFQRLFLISYLDDEILHSRFDPDNSSQISQAGPFLLHVLLRL